MSRENVLGGPLPFGYMQKGYSNTGMKINRAEAETVQLIFSLKEQKYTQAAITRYLNHVAKIPSPDGSGQWWPATVQRIFKGRRRYVGGRIRRLGNGRRWPAILGVDLDQPESEPIIGQLSNDQKPAKKRYTPRKMRQLKTL